MRGISLRIAAALQLIFVPGVACAQAGETQEAREEAVVALQDCDSPRQADLEAARFAARLLAAASDEGSETAIVSPLSIEAALGMLSQGASTSLRRALQALFVEEPAVWNPACRLLELRAAAAADSEVDLNIANAMFPSRRWEILPAFRAALEARFGARVTPLDFSDPGSTQTINDWVANETSGLIPHLLDTLGPGTVLVLVNAVYFKGMWTNPFDPALSSLQSFQPASGAAVERWTMRLVEFKALYREDENFQAVELPYGEGRFALTVVLPRPDISPADALAGLVADPSWLRAGGFGTATGGLFLPRMRLSYNEDVLPLLEEELGLGEALGAPGAFSGIPAPDLTSAIHGVELTLDEEGTEAAAATALVFTRSMHHRRFIMNVNRPFALSVRDTGSGDILFAAWVDDPGDG